MNRPPVNAPHLTKARYLYNTQKHGAKKRKIDFLISFEEWVAWWEYELGSRWMSFGGPGLRQFCMARKDDKGPYRLDNVKCIRNERNNLDALENRAFGNLDRKTVLSIYREPGVYIDVASKFDVSKSLVSEIKRKKRYAAFTKNEPKLPPLSPERYVTSGRGLTKDQILEIFFESATHAEVAEEYGVSRSVVENIGPSLTYTFWTRPYKWDNGVLVITERWSTKTREFDANAELSV